MKALSSIITLFTLIVLSGCSDTPNPIITSEEIVLNETNNRDQDYQQRTLIWNHTGMSVEANGENFVHNEILCDFQYSTRSNILVTFDGWTNADTTSYISKIYIENEGKQIFIESGELYINRHHVLRFENVRAGNLRFYISLWCDDIKCNSTAALKLSEVKIYRY